MITDLMRHLSGVPALVLKIVSLCLIDAVVLWSIPTLVNGQNFVLLAVLVISTLVLNVVMLLPRPIPPKYIVPGAILLVAFQVIPMIYTVSVAFTNYSTGHITSKSDAIHSIERGSLAVTDNSKSYAMIPAKSSDGTVVLILTDAGGGDASVGPSPGPSPSDSAGGDTFGGGTPSPTDTSGGDTFGGAPSPTDTSGGDTFGGDPSPADTSGGDTFGGAPSPTDTSGGDTFGGDPSPSDTSGGDTFGGGNPSPTDAMPTPSDSATAVPSAAPPTFIGTKTGLTPVDPAQVQADEFGTVTGVTGYTNLTDAEVGALGEQLQAYSVPTASGTLIQPQGFSTAVELTKVLSYDPAKDQFKNLQTGSIYGDSGKGSYQAIGPVKPTESTELEPGWTINVGFNTFTRIVTNPELRNPFIMVFVWTVVYALLSVLLTLALGLFLALVLNKKGLHGQKIYRALLVVPYAIPAFLSILVWKALLNDDFGFINQLTGLHIPWLFDAFWAKVSLLLVNLWLGFPYMFLVSTGALQAIPSELTEAAEVDGANPFQLFRLIKLPLLLTALAPLLVASFAFNFNNFTGIYLLTGGGPGVDNSPVAGATDILISYSYKVAFAAGKGQDFGLASAISIIIFIIVGTISAISFIRSKALQGAN